MGAMSDAVERSVPPCSVGMERMGTGRPKTTKMKLGEVAILREQDSTCDSHETVGRQGS